ncbi:MAG: hypothetical protein IJ499_03075, partial [Clostridia bacterium]|nr:hypothetical protein [Clostridia bacterium]
MVGFCGALDFPSRAVDFSNLKRMCGLHSGGCAFINREFGLLCDSVSETDDIMQPVTVRENNSLYTVAVIMDSAARGLEASTARAILEGYIEEGDSYLRRLDFSYALALYDGRCGELLICKGYKGDKPLFYTVRDGRVYFASSLRPLIRLYGGCVRVNKKILRDHINGTPKTIPEGLFRDISSVGSGCGVLCSVFGQSRISGEYVPHKAENVSAQALSNVRFTKKSNLRRILSEALFAFDYPQFDCYMPSVIPAVANTLGDKNERIFTVSCPLSEEFPEYATERM